MSYQIPKIDYIRVLSKYVSQCSATMRPKEGGQLNIEFGGNVVGVKFSLNVYSMCFGIDTQRETQNNPRLIRERSFDRRDRLMLCDGISVGRFKGLLIGWAEKNFFFDFQ